MKRDALGTPSLLSTFTAFALIGSCGGNVEIPVLVSTDISLAPVSGEAVVAVARHPSIRDEPGKLRVGRMSAQLQQIIQHLWRWERFKEFVSPKDSSINYN